MSLNCFISNSWQYSTSVCVCPNQICILFLVLYLFLWTLNNLSVSGFFSVDFGVCYVFVTIALDILHSSSVWTYGLVTWTGPFTDWTSLQSTNRAQVCDLLLLADWRWLCSRSVSVFSFLSLVFHFWALFNSFNLLILIY